MSTQTTTSEYMLLFRGAQWDKGLSPEDMQKIMGQWNNWFERLTLQGKVKSAHPLERPGARRAATRDCAPELPDTVLKRAAVMSTVVETGCRHWLIAVARAGATDRAPEPSA